MIEIILILVALAFVAVLLQKWFRNAFLLKYIAITIVINVLTYLYVFNKNYEDSMLSDTALIIIVSSLVIVSLVVLYNNYQKHKIQLSHIGMQLEELSRGRLSGKFFPIKSKTENEVRYISKELDRASNQIHHTIKAANFGVDEILKLSRQLSETLSDNTADKSSIALPEKSKLDHLSSELNSRVEALRHVLAFFR
ncbi:MAG: hypothetical protein MI866_07910 [Bacteroidales bacterium]|nr:hypothetical protein [Bacteroidales bacterium]